jgi:hypothetical protein
VLFADIFIYHRFLFVATANGNAATEVHGTDDVFNDG